MQQSDCSRPWDPRATRLLPTDLPTYYIWVGLELPNFIWQIVTTPQFSIVNVHITAVPAVSDATSALLIVNVNITAVPAVSDATSALLQLFTAAALVKSQVKYHQVELQPFIHSCSSMQYSNRLARTQRAGAAACAGSAPRRRQGLSVALYTVYNSTNSYNL